LSWEPSGNSSQGFVLSSLNIDRLAINHTDTFSYAMADEDGSAASASLTVTPGSASSTQTTALIGSAGNDNLNGDANANTITGNGGNDLLHGLGGNDTITSGSGTDALYGGAGNDTLSAGGGTTIQISSSGGFSGGYQASAVDQTIVLQSVDLTSAGVLNTDQQIIQDLLSKAKLIVDTGP